MLGLFMESILDDRGLTAIHAGAAKDALTISHSILKDLVKGFAVLPKMDRPLS